MRLSFIIPAFNIQDYISQCIESLISLPLQENDYEIIIVDDGSSDNTFAIAQKFKENHQNICLISGSNNGVSVARNKGIDAAKGDYICFVDGDDFHINHDIIDMLQMCEKSNADICRGKYMIFKDGTYTNNNLIISSYYDNFIDGREFLYLSIKNKENEVVPWLGLFKRDLLIKNKLTFDQDISYEEDQIFFLRCLLCPNVTIAQTNKYFYAYRFRSSSVTKNPTYKQALDVIKVVELEESLVAKDMDKKTIRSIRKYESSSFYQLTSIYGRVDKQTRKQIRRKLSFKMQIRCMLNPYDKHQFFKIFMFTFFRSIVMIIYFFKKRKMRSTR